MAMRVRVTTYTCPKCRHTLKREYGGGSIYGEKYGRCSKCGYIYRTGKKLYSDLSEEELKEQKNIRKEFYKIFIPTFIISLIVLIITGWQLFGAGVFLSGALLIVWFIGDLKDKTKTLKNVSKKDRELYELEVEESERIRKANGFNPTSYPQSQVAEPIYQQKEPTYVDTTTGGHINQEGKQSDESKKPKKYRVFVIPLLVIIVAGLAFAFANGGKGTSGNDDTSYITYDSYYVGVRTITLSSKSVADRIYNEWKNGKATEESMVALMDYYGTEQGGGQLYIVEPGMWIEEVDTWCFERTRQVGDVAIIESAFGYTICYFSSVIER